MNIRLTNEINFAFNADIENQSDLENTFVDAKIDYANIFISDPGQLKTKIEEWEIQLSSGLAKNPEALSGQIAKYMQMLQINLHLHVFIPGSCVWLNVKKHTYEDCCAELKRGEEFDKFLGKLTNWITES